MTAFVPCYVTDICTLPAERGPCRASIPRYYYDSATERCDRFDYGGCDGNENKFETQEECEKRCMGMASTVDLTPFTYSKHAFKHLTEYYAYSKIEKL